MFHTISDSNTKKLKENSYPGRGIILGLSPDAQHLIQVYWIMGRSDNSRNRIFVKENDFVKTKAFDESRVTDPSLIIYYPVKHLGNRHIVSNGDQTDTIYEFLKKDKSFESALNSREFEPDAPNYTPRISGLIDLDDHENAYKLSILKTVNNNHKYPVRQYFNYAKAIPGCGHCLHTYVENGDPLPSFSGEPYLVKLFDTAAENMDYYWNILNKENRIALLVKFINADTGEYQITIFNKHQG